jgi:hypothetical protein
MNFIATKILPSDILELNKLIPGKLLLEKLSESQRSALLKRISESKFMFSPTEDLQHVYGLDVVNVELEGNKIT